MKQSFAVSNKSNYVNDNDDERKILVYVYTMIKDNSCDKFNEQDTI